MSSSYVGQRIENRYIKLATSGTTPLDSDSPMDAGTAHIIDSNLSHLCLESRRDLFQDTGPGSGIDDASKGWSSLYDEAPPATNHNYTDVNQVSWSVYSSRVFGPFPATQDRLIYNDPGVRLRRIKVKIDCNANSGSSLKLFAALVEEQGRPGIGRAAFAQQQVSTGRQTVTFTLATVQPLRTTTLWQCRNNATNGPRNNPVTRFYVHIGWYSTSASDALISMCGWELLDS